jgi:general secretion pathway protein G
VRAVNRTLCAGARCRDAGLKDEIMGNLYGASRSSVAATSGGCRGRVARERGMTLIEILVVLTLIGVVLGIVGSNYLGKSEQAKAKAAKIEIEQISQALDLFKLELGRYPTTQEGLQALVAAPPGLANWAGPYWKKSTTPKDPWSHEYKYASPGTHGAYDIISLGADGAEGGEGANKDVTNWE